MCISTQVRTRICVHMYTYMLELYTHIYVCMTCIYPLFRRIEQGEHVWKQLYGRAKSAQGRASRHTSITCIQAHFNHVHPGTLVFTAPHVWHALAPSPSTSTQISACQMLSQPECFTTHTHTLSLSLCIHEHKKDRPQPGTVQVFDCI